MSAQQRLVDSMASGLPPEEAPLGIHLAFLGAVLDRLDQVSELQGLGCRIELNSLGCQERNGGVRCEVELFEPGGDPIVARTG